MMAVKGQLVGSHGMIMEARTEYREHYHCSV